MDRTQHQRQRRAGIAGVGLADERATLRAAPHDDEPGLLQQPHRLAHDGAADAKLGAERMLGGEPVGGLIEARLNAGANLLGDLVWRTHEP